MHYRATDPPLYDAEHHYHAPPFATSLLCHIGYPFLSRELSFFPFYGQMVALPLQRRPYSLYTCLTLDPPPLDSSLGSSLFDSSLFYGSLLFWPRLVWSGLVSSRRGLPRPWQIGRQQSDCLVARQRAAARRRR
ncbi:uncharacterized protein LOC143149878 [Ptiloglossa arizonensis]|uniref:uncharacterized protein LOC143149878 n=1 Tax=Ptiloglossa arizonensis TaxID=3350558 RepID=UPI003FA1603E